MKTLISLSLICLACIQLSASQRYNPHSNRWETVPQDAEMRYNPHSNSWSYQPPGARIEYNAHENQWDWDSGHNGY